MANAEDTEPPRRRSSRAGAFARGRSESAVELFLRPSPTENQDHETTTKRSNVAPASHYLRFRIVTATRMGRFRRPEQWSACRWSSVSTNPRLSGSRRAKCCIAEHRRPVRLRQRAPHGAPRKSARPSATSAARSSIPAARRFTSTGTRDPSENSSSTSASPTVLVRIRVDEVDTGVCRIPPGRARNEWVRVRMTSHHDGELLGG